MKKLIGLMACVMLLGLSSVFAQSKQVTGTVTDKSGFGLPGVSVSIKGTSEGANTDIDGKWMLTVTSKDVLEFSFMGMKTQEIKVGDKTIINVVLEEDRENLDEVMVVAYGTAKKESFTGSAASIRKEDALKISGGIGQKLQGKVAGVQVIGGDVRIRGYGSFSASSEPLYVIDGVVGAPKPNDEDIENITVLKDAASTALYGSRGANGVIIITSKKGKKDKKPTFEFKYQRTINKLIEPEWDIMGAADYFDYQNKAVNNWLQTTYGIVGSDKYENMFRNRRMNNNNPYNMDDPYEFYDVKYLDKDGNEQSYVSTRLKEGAKLLYDTNWKDTALKNAIKDEVYFSVSGGSAQSYYNWSTKAYKYDGNIRSIDEKGANSQFNYAVELNDHVKVGLNSRVAYYEGQGSTTSGSSENNHLYLSYVLSPAAPMYKLNKVDNGDGTYSYKNALDARGNKQWAWDNPNYKDYNPIALMEMDWQKNYGINVFFAPHVNISFTKNLTWRTQLSARLNSQRSDEWQNPYHGSGQTEDGVSTKSSSISRDWNLQSILKYKFDLGEDHHFDALLGYESRKYIYQSHYGRKAGYPLGDISTELSTGVKPRAAGSGTTEVGMISYISQLTYNYLEKYYLSGSFRRDGSSKFGPDNRWGNFWSVGASWRISQEDFLQVDAINNLKLRTSYGVTGNDGIGNYRYGNYYSIGANYGGVSGIAHTNLPNYDLGWEQNKSFSVGVDFDLFDQSRLTGTVEFFHKNTDGLLYSLPLPVTTGFTSVLMNLSEMQNTGFELELNGKILTGDFTWDMSGTLTYVKNEIMSLPVDEMLSGTKKQVVGGSMYDYWIKEWAGVNSETGRGMFYVDPSRKNFTDKDGNAMTYEQLVATADADGNIVGYANEDNKINKYSRLKLVNGRLTTTSYAFADKFSMGQSTPDFYASLSNSFAYKGFDFSMQLLGAFGHKIYDGRYAQYMHDGSGKARNLAEDAKNAWTHPGQKTDVPFAYYGNSRSTSSTSSRWLVDGDFVKIKNITLGYTVPERVCKMVALKYARVFGTVDNLASFSKFKSGDPEISLSGIGSGTGLPTSTTIRFGVNIKF